MLGPLVAMILVVGQTPPTGRLIAASGAVTVERAGRSPTADAQSTLEAGDRLTTGEGAGAALFLGGDTVVYLGPATRLTLAPVPGEAAELSLEKGEIRVSADSPRDVSVRAPAVGATIRRGTLRAAVGGQGARFFAEREAASLSIGGRAAVALTQGQEAGVGPDGTLRAPGPPAPGGWSLDAASVRLAAAAAESRRGKVMQVARVNDDTSRDFATSQLGQTTVGAATPPGTGATPPDNAAAGSNAPANPPGAAPPNNAEDAEAAANAAYQPQALSQANSSFSSITGSLALGGAGGAVAFAGSGGQGNDAQQDSLNPLFPGNIYLVTGLTRYSINQVRLTSADHFFPTDRQYYSIGLGAPPTTQVRTNFLTGTGATPESVRIPHFNAYVVNLTQFGIPDPGTAPVSNTNPSFTGISGLLGPNPSSPQIVGATPLLDSRAKFNPNATFALGEFALQRDPSHPSTPQIEIRRSDQDRLIVPGTGKADPVIPNPDVRFGLVKDPSFFPQFPNGVYVPQMNSLANKPTFSSLDPLRLAAVTVLLADKLLDYSHRTGQTQFVLDGRIIDIAGYSRRLQSPAPSPTTVNSATSSVRSPVVPAQSASTLAGAEARRSGQPSLRDFGPRGEVSRPGASAQRVAAQRAAVAHR